MVGFRRPTANRLDRCSQFLDDDYIKQLADPSEDNKAFRLELFEKFRDPLADAVDPYKLPYMLGSGAIMISRQRIGF